MTSRERIRTALRRQESDRVPRVEQSYWPDTLTRWRREGMPDDTAPADLFERDPFVTVGLDSSSRLPMETLEETDEWVLECDADGVVNKRWSERYGPPSEVDTLINTRPDWEHHREFAKLCHDNDMFLILHCDGDVRQFVPLLIEAGYDCIEPLEARAGNDVREMKPLYGDRLSFFGNIDMDVLATGDRDLIRHEVVSKVEAAKAGGGYLHQSDHSVPPTVSYDSYRYWMELSREPGEYE